MDLLAPDGTWVLAGTLMLADLKTGAKLDFSVPAYSVQLALYATGELYDVIDERRLPTPPINQNWTLLIHLPVGMNVCRLYWCSVEVGLYGAWLAHEVKKWQNAWKRGDHDIHLVPVPEAPVIDRLAAAGIEAEVVMDDDIRPQMLEFCIERIRRIGIDDRARQWLLSEWPEGLPTPKQGGHTSGQVVQLLDLLDEIEKKFSLPFLPDPRAELQRGIHKSEMDRSNEFKLTKE
jgi:hypothetical protein